MRITVADAARQLEARGLLERVRHNQSDRIIPRMEALLGQPLPADLIDFYQEGIVKIGGYRAYLPVWSDWVGWHATDSFVTELALPNAFPLFPDGCGSIFGLDLTPGVETPAVYFFDHCDLYERPHWAAGSSLGAFLVLYGDHDTPKDEWFDRWELQVDPDIDKCPRARAIWNAG
jgi:hypothetical protein